MYWLSFRCPAGMLKIEPIMSCWFHTRKHNRFAEFFLDVLQPCLKRGKTSFIIAKCEWFLGKFNVSPIQMLLHSGFHYLHQFLQSTFSVIDLILAFCIVTIHGIPLCLIRFFTNRPKSVILFYMRVFFFSTFFLRISYILNYTGAP